MSKSTSLQLMLLLQLCSLLISTRFEKCYANSYPAIINEDEAEKTTNIVSSMENDNHQKRNVEKQQSHNTGNEDDEEYVDASVLANDYSAFIGAGNVASNKKSPAETSKAGPKVWDHWGKWGPCSVSCGVGKITRWRHCVAGGCASGEKEAQIKTCTLPAC